MVMGSSGNDYVLRAGIERTPHSRRRNWSDPSPAQRHQCGEGARRVQRPCPCPLVLESAQRSLPSRRVVVRKDVTERTETVRDDVRREEVDVRDANRRRS
jgi:hypothetical protein